MLLETANWTIEQWQAFEDECFRDWLNKIDAMIGYDERRALADVEEWKELFGDGEFEGDAIELMRAQ